MKIKGFLWIFNHRKADDPLTAIEVIMLANRLLKIVDVRKDVRKLDNTVICLRNDMALLTK